MPEQSPQANNKLVPGYLPLEIVSMIVKYFAAQLEIIPSDPMNSADEPFMYLPETKKLLNLRLVSKIWAHVVIPIAFHSIRLISPHSVDCLRNNQQDSILYSTFSPVKRMCIENLFWEKSHWLNSDGELDEEKELKTLDPQFPLVLRVSDVIELFGIKLTELKLKFPARIGIDSDMMCAIKQIKCLKKLNIHSEELPEGSYADPKSLAELLNATPNLESLSIYFPHLEVLQLEPQALSKLRHLWFWYSPRNIKGLHHLIKAAKDSLKVIEYLAYHRQEDPGKAIKPMHKTLESLFIDIIPDHIPDVISNTTFPRLRVMRSIEWPLKDFDLTWILWPIFFHVRTLVTSFECGRPYWRSALENLGEDDLTRSPNLKHIVFTSHPDDVIQQDEALAEDLRIHGIYCHFMPQMNYERILELDLDLNGPMESSYQDENFIDAVEVEEPEVQF
ncbi:uncharacterized protein MELLADRAFT_95864 [Melampsora larici-populina 98AG31]|uniref:F-box domain-containing protein n=1 Tax=Melampsora larici-populina (strain 98AG31 / pathotype 3-4-7) TaxID=747676 RepID=F4RDJ1_MELLP|nr:uncharacterized protein MELLADRAFT_95864 [Melampsora larici-populina 98AG31]EGG09599.1 hypothetical protein MELLADRAFT_95864 [Melampsora larici-populina 98AG31]